MKRFRIVLMQFTHMHDSDVGRAWTDVQLIPDTPPEYVLVDETDNTVLRFAKDARTLSRWAFDNGVDEVVWTAEATKANP